MDSQFDIVSSAIQDTLGEPYDYRSIMHYGSSAFSRNGRNTLEAVVEEFTNVIGTAMELSEMDVAKIMKLYRCKHRHEGSRRFGMLPSSGPRSLSTWRKRKMTSLPAAGDRHQQLDNHHNQLPPSSPSSTRIPFVDVGDEDDEATTAEAIASLVPTDDEEEDAEFGSDALPRAVFETTTRRASTEKETEESVEQTGHSSRRRKGSSNRCRDHFLDCPQFRDYCKRISFYFIMRSYCPHTCGRCGSAPAARGVEEDEAEATVEEDEEQKTSSKRKDR